MAVSDPAIPYWLLLIARWGWNLVKWSLLILAIPAILYIDLLFGANYFSSWMRTIEGTITLPLINYTMTKADFMGWAISIGTSATQYIAVMLVAADGFKGLFSRVDEFGEPVPTGRRVGGLRPTPCWVR